MADLREILNKADQAFQTQINKLEDQQIKFQEFAKDKNAKFPKTDLIAVLKKAQKATEEMVETLEKGKALTKEQQAAFYDIVLREAYGQAKSHEDKRAIVDILKSINKDMPHPEKQTRVARQLNNLDIALRNIEMTGGRKIIAPPNPAIDPVQLERIRAEVVLSNVRLVEQRLEIMQTGIHKGGGHPVYLGLIVPSALDKGRDDLKKAYLEALAVTKALKQEVENNKTSLDKIDPDKVKRLDKALQSFADENQKTGKRIAGDIKLITARSKKELATLKGTGKNPPSPAQLERPRDRDVTQLLRDYKSYSEDYARQISSFQIRIKRLQLIKEPATDKSKSKEKKAVFNMDGLNKDAIAAVQGLLKDKGLVGLVASGDRVSAPTVPIISSEIAKA